MREPLVPETFYGPMDIVHPAPTRASESLLGTMVRFPCVWEPEGAISR